MSARPERPDVGSRWGRWTVIKRAAPAQRYAETYQRARVVVRCVCGDERTVFESDLRAGKTSGCRRSRCLARWHAAEALRAQVDRSIAAFLLEADDSGP